MGNGTDRKQDHPWLPHHDARALDKFGSPVIGSSSLPFEASYALLPWINMRTLQDTATCQRAKCPEVKACSGLGFGTCHAPEAEGPWALSRVVVLRDVFVDNQGVVFNGSGIINFEDCTLGTREDPQPWHSHRKGARVVHLDRAFSLVHHWGRNFYHSLVEVLPVFFALANFLKQDPGIPVLMKQNLYEEYVRYGERVTGVPATALNVVFPINVRVQVLVKELIQPQYPKCMDPERHFLNHLRRHYFLHPDGFPFLDEELNPRPRLASKLTTTAEKLYSDPSKDWRVVLFLRTRGLARSILNEEEVIRSLEDQFGREKVIVLRKDLDIEEARELFQSTRLVVSVHGASLTNMIFMPEGAAVLEVRLRQYNKRMYEDMAQRAGLHYFSTFVDGGKGSPVTADIFDVNKQLGDIEDYFKEET